MIPENARLIGQGKAKDIYQTAEGNILFDYTPRVTAFDGEKKAEFEHKGEVCCRLSAFWFDIFRNEGIDNHFLELVSPTVMMVEPVEILPVEVICRNFLTGSLWKRYNKGEAPLPPDTEAREGAAIPGGYVAYTTKFEATDRPVTKEEILENGWMSEEDMDFLESVTREINDCMKEYLDHKGIVLADFKVEYGRRKTRGNGDAGEDGSNDSGEGGEIILADEVGTPDVCRFWDKEAFEKGEIVRMDKDVFRRGEGNLDDVYLMIYRKIVGQDLHEQYEGD